MAKVTGPLLSIDARGTVADTLVFSYWRGQHYVRRWLKPANPNTAAQQTQRGYLALSIEKWHEYLLAADRAAWSQYQAGMPSSGVNQFVSEYVIAQAGALELCLSKNIVAAAGNDQVTITGTSSIATLWTVMYGDKHRVYTGSVNETGDPVTSHSIVVTGLTGAVEYFFRIAAVDPDNDWVTSGEYKQTPT